MMNKLFRKIAVVTCGVAMMFPFAMIHAEDTVPSNASSSDDYTVKNVVQIEDFFMPGTVIEKGSDKNYVYCVQPGYAWPVDGLVYKQTSVPANDPVFDADTLEKIQRAIFAGYPMDDYGFSNLTEEPTLKKAGYTQQVIWAILKNPLSLSFINVSESAYLKTLYEYATTGLVDGKAPTEKELGTVKLKSSKELELQTNNIYTGSITFDSSKQVAVTITTIPEGVRLYSDEAHLVELTKGASIDSNTTIYVASETASTGLIDFSYNSKRINKKLTVFSTDEIYKSDNPNNNKAYQEMMGFSYQEEVTKINTKFTETTTTDDTPVVTPTTDDTPVVTPTTDDTPVVTPTTDDRQVTPTTNEEVTTPATTETVVTPVTTETVERPSTPNTSETPNTGDETNIALFGGLLGFAVIAAGAVVVLKKKYSL